MLKQKFTASGILVLLILLLLSLQTYRINQKHQSIYSNLLEINQIQKDLNRLQLLTGEFEKPPIAVKRINTQWNKLYQSIASRLQNTDADLRLHPIKNTINYQPVNGMLAELRKDYALLLDLVGESEKNPPLSAEVVVLKLNGELTNLSSHIETHAQHLVSLLSVLKREQRTWTIALVAATLLVLTFMHWNIYRLVLMPVGKLLGSIEKFGSGNLSTRSSIKQNDEVGRLADSFNAMAKQIADSFAIEQRLRENLQENHDKLLEANHLAKLGHWRWNLRTGEHHWSDKIYDIYGRDKSLSPSDYPSVQEYFTPSAWDGIVRNVERCRQEGIPYEVEAQVVRPDGETRYIVARGSAVRDGSEIVALHGTVQDVTELKRNQEELAVSEEKYRLAMEATHDGLWDWDITKNRVEYSPSWLQILGETDIGHTFESWESRIHPDDRPRVMESLQQHLNGVGEAWQQEHRLKKKEGGWAWVLGRGKVVKCDENHHPLRMIGTLTDINSQKEQEQVIWEQANYDSLTRLPNRKLFSELLEKSISLARRKSENVWLMFLDLDGFKEVNDNLGHDIGDKLLIQVAERLKNSIRQADTVARLGGDEFVIIISGVSNIMNIDKIASHIIETLGESYRIDSHEVCVTTSVGIANFPRDADNTKELLQYADQSMYAAKNEGKNRHNYFTASLQYESQLRIELAAKMRTAINEQQFQLHYQPIIDLNLDQIHKAEALIRWHLPGKGVFPSSSFIPLAEETGMICDIGIWTLSQVLRQLEEWLAYDDHFQISVNMSPAQLKTKDRKYQERIDDLSASPLFRNRLVIEIKENMLLTNDDLVNQKLIRYRDHGIQVAIDDFGTGYSSLSYLKKYDVEYLKIDQSFIEGLTPGSTEEVLCNAMINLAHSLNMKVIAEGIETQSQHDMLKRLNCDFAQGFYYCNPIPPDEFKSRFFRTH